MSSPSIGAAVDVGMDILKLSCVRDMVRRFGIVNDCVIQGVTNHIMKQAAEPKTGSVIWLSDWHGIRPTDIR